MTEVTSTSIASLTTAQRGSARKGFGLLNAGKGSNWLKRPPQLRTSREAGYTIVELSIAVAIAGVLLVSAISLVQGVLNNNRANETITLLSKSLAQIDKVWADQNTYAGLSLDTAAAANAFPGLVLTRDKDGKVTQVTSKFNRPILLQTISDIPSPGLNRGYAMVFPGIPTSVCGDLVTAAAGAGIRGISITPEAVAGNSDFAAVAPSGMEADGGLKVPANTVVAMSGKAPLPDLTATLSTGGCGTSRPTVALTFVSWK